MSSDPGDLHPPGKSIICQIILYAVLPSSFCSAWMDSEWSSWTRSSVRLMSSSRALVTSTTLLLGKHSCFSRFSCVSLIEGDWVWFLYREQERRDQRPAGQDEKWLHCVQHGPLKHGDWCGKLLATKAWYLNILNPFLADANASVVLICDRRACAPLSWPGRECVLKWTMSFGLMGRGLSCWLRSTLWNKHNNQILTMAAWQSWPHV